MFSNVPAGAAARGRRVCAREEVEGVDAARAATLATAAVEKNALVFFALFSALRERRCTPRCVSMVDDVDDGGSGGKTVSRTGHPRIKFIFTLSSTSALPTFSDATPPPTTSPRRVPGSRLLLFSVCHPFSIAMQSHYAPKYTLAGQN